MESEGAKKESTAVEMTAVLVLRWNYHIVNNIELQIIKGSVR